MAASFTSVSAGTLSAVGGRPLVASGCAPLAGLTVSAGCVDTLKRHIALTSCSDLRVVFLGVAYAASSEVDAGNPVLIRCSVAVGAVVIPVVFGGKQTGQLDPNGILISEPVGVDVTAGDVFYTRTRQEAPMGAAIVLSSAVSALDTSFQTATAPTVGFTGGVVQLSGSSIDAATVVSITGSGPYTWTLKSGTSIAHSHTTANSVYQNMYSNSFAYADYGEAGLSNSATDYSSSGSYPALGQNVRTISASVLAGATKIQMSNYVYAPSLVLNTGGGTAETVTPRTIVFDGANYFVYLAAPTVNAHNSAETVTPALSVAYFSTAFAPNMIVADRIKPSSARPKAVIVSGDSIAQSTGYTSRGLSSWVTLALDGVKPFINAALGGESGATFATLAASKRRRGLLSTADWYLYAYGANDLGFTGAQIWANTQTALQLAKNRGLHTAVCTITPRTTSIDGFLTAANQTLAGNEANRLAYNALVRAAAGGALADVVVDTADAVEVNASNVLTRNGGRWYSDGGAVPYTMDGTHPTILGHAMIAAAVNTGVFA